MRNEKERIFLLIGIIFIICGIGSAIWSTYKYMCMESATAIYKVENHSHRGKNTKRASVTYEYDGVKYEDIYLDSYNAFTMKTGKKTTIYFKKSKPEQVYVLSVEWVVIFILFGMMFLLANKKPKSKKKKLNDNAQNIYRL